MSPIPDLKAWDIDTLITDWMGLTVYPFPPSAHLHRVILNQAMLLSDHTNSPRLTRDALVLGPSAALNRDPTSTPSVNNIPKTVPQLRVAHNPQLFNLLAWCLGVDNSQEHGFSVGVAERISTPQRSSTRTIYKSKWALFEK